MKLGMIALVGCGLVVGCGNDVQETQQTASSAAESTPVSTPVSTPASTRGTGSFNGRVGEKSYAVEVKCSSLGQRYFNFKSDKTDAADSNGDGLIISGLQNTDDFILTIIDNGVTYTAARLASFEKSDVGAQGSGTLFDERSLESFEAEFSVTCQ